LAPFLLELERLCEIKETIKRKSYSKGVLIIFTKM